MRCIIVEDQPPAQRILKKFIQDVPTLELVQVLSDGLTAMEFLNKESVEIGRASCRERVSTSV